MSSPNASTARPLNCGDLRAMREAGEKIACLTAYDASFAMIADEAGIDVVLVGDSLGMVLQGRGSPTAVTVDDVVPFSWPICRFSATPRWSARSMPASG